MFIEALGIGVCPRFWRTASTAVLAIRGLVSRGLILAVRSRETSSRPGAGERFEVNRYRIVVEDGDECREDGTEGGLKTGPRPIRKSDYASTGIKPGGGPENRTCKE